jgi:hypothetical protein
MKRSGEKPSITELTCSIRGGQADDRGRAARWFMMANQIAKFFATKGEARAVPQIAVHIPMDLLRWIRATAIARRWRWWPRLFAWKLIPQAMS